MTCNFDCDNCTVDDDYQCPPICNKPSVSKAIDRSVSMLVAMDKQIDDETDLASVTMVVNAEWLANVCTSLLEYAVNIDEVDVDELFEFEDIASALPQMSAPITKH